MDLQALLHEEDTKHSSQGCILSCIIGDRGGGLQALLHDENTKHSSQGCMKHNGGLGDDFRAVQAIAKKRVKNRKSER